MWGLLIEIVKPVLGVAFGSPKATKITLLILTMGVFGGLVWYWTDVSADKDRHLLELKLANETFLETQNQLKTALAQQAEAMADQQLDFKDAVTKQIALKKTLDEVAEARKREQEIFKRKSKTFEQMLQRRGETIVRLANTGTERVRKRWTKEINDISNRLQEGAGNLFTSPETKPTESE